MKQTPELATAQENMRPGVISLDGFLGSDMRLLRAILQDDDAVVASMGLDHAAIADRLRYFTTAAKAALGMSAVVDEVYEVRIHEVRGSIHCPWPHPGGYPKNVIYLRRTDTGEEVKWTELQIHLIEVHGFYEGKDSVWRLSPRKLGRVLGTLGSTE